MLVPEGDSLVMFTDGVTEANAVDMSMFGEERLEAELSLTALAGPEGAVAAIQDAVRRFAAGTEQADDITVLSARFNGPVQAVPAPAPPRQAVESEVRLSAGPEV